MYSLIEDRSIFLNFPKISPIPDKMKTGNTMLIILIILIHLNLWVTNQKVNMAGMN